MRTFYFYVTAIMIAFTSFNSNSQCTGNYYVVDANPWGNTFGPTAMDNVFGAPNWTPANFATAGATIFAPSVCFVMLEGSDANALALNTFLTNNLTLIESWVNAGGRLFINAAPNQGGNINLGFNGTLLNYANPSSTATAVNVNDPIFLGPNLPTATFFTGSSYSHAWISGVDLNVLLSGDIGQSILASKNWGSGVVFFGGITQPNFHTPTTEAINLWYNIFAYAANISLCNAPDVPALNASVSEFCPGNNTSVNLSITAGNLNDGTQWYWYSGSCGGTPAGTGTSITVNVNATTTYYARGEDGCIGACAEITLGDVTLPSITAPADLTINTDEGSCEATSVVLGTPNTSDNCAVASVVNDAPSVFPTGPTTVTWTVTDDSGNSSTATQVVTVVNLNPPTIACPFVSLSVNSLPGQCGAPVTYANPTAQGDCSGGTPDLEDVLANFDANNLDVLSLIPNAYVFNMDNGLNANNINDGGNDMYDGGNYLNTNYATNIFYSDGVILPSAAFGTNGQFFTRYVSNGALFSNNPAMFILAADVDNVSTFTITGNNGADGSGNVDGSTLLLNVNGTDYNVFIKRVFNAGDPSINQVMVVPANASAAHTFSTDSNDDFHELSGITATERLYYLLYAGNAGSYINDAATQLIVEEFLNSIGSGASLTIAQTDATGLSSGDIFPIGVTTLEYTATDASGNTATCSFTIEVISETSVSEVVTADNGTNNGAIDITLSGGASPYTFSWSGPNGFTAVTEDISGLASGMYDVTITDGDGCDVTYSFEVNSTVGIATEKLETFSVYPNPTNSVVNIEFISNGEFQLFNVNGQLISTESVKAGTMVKDVSYLATGIYTIRFTNESGVSVQKLVVSK